MIPPGERRDVSPPVLQANPARNDRECQPAGLAPTSLSAGIHRKYTGGLTSRRSPKTSS
jgi:hypothetical protein